MPEARSQQFHTGIGAAECYLFASGVAQQVEALTAHQIQLGLMQVFP
jgi:hypothetical protein